MKLTITRPDDWHLHLRDGPGMHSVVPHTALQYQRALIMPNLKPPVTDVDSALAYRQRILDALPPGLEFNPLMTLYLTENTTLAEVEKAAASEHVIAFKLYPAGATTNSDSGVSELSKIYPILDRMQELGLVLCVHGEVVDHDVDIFDRERAFVEKSLHTIVEQFPRLKVVLEHVSTRDAVQFVLQAPANVAATVTPQHLMYSRNALLAGGLRPHFYCLPILKRERHRQAIVEAVVSGSRKFFLGTDSAPHPIHAKESACGCAGIFSAHASLELYAEVFEAHDSLDKLEAFASFNGADFYGLPRNQEQVTLVKEDWEVPAYYDFGQDRVMPLKAGESVHWKLL